METKTSYSENQSINEFDLPIYFGTTNLDAAIYTSTNKLHSGGGLGLNLIEAGMTAGECDGGAVLTTHQEFNNIGSTRVTQKDSLLLPIIILPM